MFIIKTRVITLNNFSTNKNATLINGSFTVKYIEDHFGFYAPVIVSRSIRVNCPECLQIGTITSRTYIDAQSYNPYFGDVRDQVFIGDELVKCGCKIGSHKLVLLNDVLSPSACVDGITSYASGIYYDLDKTSSQNQSKSSFNEQPEEPAANTKKIHVGKGNVIDASKAKDNIAISQKSNESPNLKEHLPKEQLVQQTEILKQDIMDFRAGLPSKLKNGGNAASAEINIDGMSTNKLLAHSRIDDPVANKGIVGKGNNIFNTQYLPNKQGELIDRVRDSEAKILEHIAKQLGNNTSAKGGVTIMTERPACASCLGVADQFRSKYPNIKVNIIDNGGNIIKPTRKN